MMRDIIREVSGQLEIYESPMGAGAPMEYIYTTVVVANVSAPLPCDDA